MVHFQAGPKEWCDKLHTCHSCTANEGCVWEIEKISKCREEKRKSTSSTGNLTGDTAQGKTKQNGKSGGFGWWRHQGEDHSISHLALRRERVLIFIKELYIPNLPT